MTIEILSVRVHDTSGHISICRYDGEKYDRSLFAVGWTDLGLMYVEVFWFDVTRWLIA